MNFHLCQQLCSYYTVVLVLIPTATRWSKPQQAELVPLKKKRVVRHVSGEGLAPIVSAYSRLILVDVTVLLTSNRLLLKGQQNQRATRPKTKEEK